MATESNVPMTHEPGMFAQLLNQIDSSSSTYYKTRAGLRPDLTIQMARDFQNPDKKDLSDMGPTEKWLAELKIIHHTRASTDTTTAANQRYAVKEGTGPTGQEIIPAVNIRAHGIWKEYQRKAKNADERFFPDDNNNGDGPITRTMNEYKNLSCIGYR